MTNKISNNITVARIREIEKKHSKKSNGSRIRKILDFLKD